MDNIISLEGRRKILDWRDSHCQKVEDQLNREFILLRSEIESIIDSSSFIELLSRGSFHEKKIVPIVDLWMRLQEEDLISAAQIELNLIHQNTISVSGASSVPSPHDGGTIIQDASVAIGTTAVAGVAVAAMVPTIVTTASVGGVMGFLGVTTTVVAWPVALGVLGIVGVASAVTGTKLLNLQDRAKRDYRTNFLPKLEASILNGQRDRLISSIKKAADDSLRLLEVQ